MKNVLLLAHDDKGQEARLEAALGLTRALDGHLSCIDVTMLPPCMGDDYAAIGGAMLLADERARESTNRTNLEARLMQEDVPWDWTDIVGSLSQGVLAAATLADIVVLNRKLDRYAFPDMRDVASRVLMHARTPVFAVPDTLPQLRLGRVLIAWDGQNSVAMTLRAVVPLLRLADAVAIATIRDGTSGVPPTDAAAYLSRHGIHADIAMIDNGPFLADHHLNAESERFGADYIVMGAYGHGRLMETFGGVTRRMLGNAKVPLLLGH